MRRLPTRSTPHTHREALAAHSAYTRMAMRGEGIDRHMLGLRLAAAEVTNKVFPVLSGIVEVMCVCVCVCVFCVIAN